MSLFSTMSSSTNQVVAPSATTNTSLNVYNLANVLGYVLNVIIVFGFGSLGWGDRPTNGELSDKYQTILTPKSWAFSIWGPIFILEFLWVVWQLLPSQRNSPGLIATGYWYLGVCLAQVGWTLSFSFEVIWLSLLFMYGILACLLAIHINLQDYQKVWKGYFLWQFPFSLHIGWITAASILNTNLILVAYGASAMAQFGVAIASLIVVIGFAVTILIQYPVDLTPPLVLVWALGGIYAELEDPMESITATFAPGQIDGIQTGVLAVLASVLGMVLSKLIYVCLVQRRRATATPSSSAPRPSAQETDVEANQAKTGLEKQSDTSEDDN